MIKMRPGRAYRLGIGAIIKCTQATDPTHIVTELLHVPRPEPDFASRVWNTGYQKMTTEEAIREWCFERRNRSFYRYHEDGMVDVRHEGHPLNVVMEILP